MFTDSELTKLHESKVYQAENGIKNITYTLLIIRTKASGMVSLSVGSDGGVSLSASLLSILWILIRYYYITKELVFSRSFIIEGLLSSEYKYDQKSIIKDSMSSSNLWLEFKEEKMEMLESACLKFIDKPENRVLLASHSSFDYDQCVESMNKARNVIKDIFRIAMEELLCRLKDLGLRKYEDLLRDRASISCMQDKFVANIQTGNLTNQVTAIEPKVGE